VDIFVILARNVSSAQRPSRPCESRRAVECDFHPAGGRDGVGKNVAQAKTKEFRQMAAALLVLFPLLLMFNSRLAFVALALAIVLLYTGRTKSAHRRTTQHIDDSSI
jgi:hypothetical protein